MTRNANGILAIVVLLSFFAPGFRGGQDVPGPTLKGDAKSDKTAADYLSSAKEETAR